MTKIAAITGAASGIGKAIIQRLAKEDISSVILDIDESDSKAVVEGLQRIGKKVRFRRMNVTDERDVQVGFEQILSQEGRIDILVNVVGGGILPPHALEDLTLAQWRAIVDLNLTSTFLCCRAVLRAMKQQQSGSIVNISSDTAFSGSPRGAAYAATKAGILGLTRSLARDLAPFGARANAVAPGLVASSKPGPNDARRQMISKSIPLGHMGQPEDVAEAVWFLVSESGRHFTGQTLRVNGGRTMT